MRALPRCLVSARDPQHFCFSFQPTNRVFNEKLNVFLFDSPGAFAVLQSRVHVAWASYNGRTTGSAGTLSYSKTDCFDTFAFPQPDPRTVIPTLEEVGQRLHDTRAKYMSDTQQGLTQTYNKLKDPACHDSPIIELRRLHEEMDRAVLDAYTWKDIAVPPYCPATPAEHKALEHFQDEVIDRLFVLNAHRAEDERRLGVGDGKKGKQKGRVKKAAKDTASENQRKLDLE